MNLDTILNEIDNISFSKKPNSIPLEYRPMYKISEIILILRFCGRSNTLGILKMQFINWLLKEQSLIDFFKNNSNNNNNLLFSYLHIDPTINLSIDYAIGSKLVEITPTGKIKLTTIGINFADQIIEEKMMENSLSILKKIGKNVKVNVK